MADGPKVPPEIRGSFAALWAANFSPDAEREIVAKMISEELWIEGAKVLEELVDCDKRRGEFLAMCWNEEKDEAFKDDEAHNPKRAKVFDL